MAYQRVKIGAQNSNFANKSVSSFGTSVNLVNYTSSNPYTAPCDGYMTTYCVAVQGRLATGYVVGGAMITSNGLADLGTNYNSLFVRKGMQLYGTKDSYTGDYQSAVTFKPINYSI